MKIVVTDVMQSRLRQELMDCLQVPTTRWEFCDAQNESELTTMLADADIYVGSVLTPRMAKAAVRLRLVQVAGAGVDRIALEALPPTVTVANTYHHGPAIAEYVVMVMLALSRDLLNEDRKLRRGQWDGVFQNPKAKVHDGLAGQTLGLIGFGETGTNVARLGSAFGMRVVRGPRKRFRGRRRGRARS